MKTTKKTKATKAVEAAMNYSQHDAGQLEKLLDKTLRDLDAIHEALAEESDAERALEKADRAIERVGGGLDQIAARRARRYLRAVDSGKRPA